MTHSTNNRKGKPNHGNSYMTWGLHNGLFAKRGYAKAYNADPEALTKYKERKG